MEERRTEYIKLESALREHLSHENHRLDRIEEKLDRLTDTVVALARAEEKLINLEKSRQEINDVLDDHEERIAVTEKRVGSIEITTNVISKLFWIGMASLAAYTASNLL